MGTLRYGRHYGLHLKEGTKAQSGKFKVRGTAEALLTPKLYSFLNIIYYYLWLRKQEDRSLEI